MFLGQRLHSRIVRALALFLFGAFAVLPAQAGGPLAVNGQGQPMAWDTAGPITYNLDNEALGQLTIFETIFLAQDAFGEWASTGVVTFSAAAAMSGDINATDTPGTNPNHYKNYWRVPGDGFSPLIFDNDGGVIDGLFGVGARFDILGLAGIDDEIAVDTTIDEGSIVINGLFYDGVGLPDSPEDLPSELALRAVLVHEIGHFLNLDHSLVNGEFASDGSIFNDVYIATMYPLSVDEEEQIAVLNPDDIAALKTVYGTSPATGVSGSVSAGGVPFQGAEIIVRKVGDELWNAYSFISGGLFQPCNAGSTCDPCNTACDPGDPAVQGEWSIDFVDPGDYTVCVRQIDTRLSVATGSFIGPLRTPPTVPGPEECYSTGEASAAASDDPESTVAVTAGTVTNVDILLNDLPLDDAAAEPNDDFGSATALPDLTGGKDTVPGFVSADDVDVYAVPVTAGQRLVVDIDAAEMDSTLDAILALYDDVGALVTIVDDAIDPHTQAYTLDPALDTVVDFSGTAKLLVTSFPDEDLDGLGGLTPGPYWLRVDVELDDADGDGIPDVLDDCPSDPGDNIDGDGICTDSCPLDFNTGSDPDADGVDGSCDNCSSFNPDQADVDGDGEGDACDDTDGDGIPDDGDGSGVAEDFPCPDGVTFACDDNCQVVANPGQEDFNGNGYGDACEPSTCVLNEGGSNPFDLDGDCYSDRFDVCPLVYDPGQEDGDNDGFGDACDGGRTLIVVRPVLTDDGDNDGFADSNETVGMSLRVRNPTDAPLTGVTMTLSTSDPNICIWTATVTVGTVDAGATVLSPEPFVFSVADVQRTTVDEDLSVTFDVTVTTNQTGTTTLPAPLGLDLDLDVAGGSGADEYVEDFEEGLDSFEGENLNAGIDTLVEADGLRCQTHDPDAPNSVSGPDPECFPSNSAAHADSFYWSIDDFSANDGGRAFGGTRSLYYGVDRFDGRTTPSSALEAVRTADPINLGWDNVAPELSFKHQISFLDERTLNAEVGHSVDRAVVMVQTADDVDDPTSYWIKVYPHRNLYDQKAADNFVNCIFDPTDDGSDEDDFFDPTDPNRMFGPASTCGIDPVFAFLGSTSTGGLGNAEGPALSGSMGTGIWVESRFDLSRWRGQRIRLRFLVTGLKLAGTDTWADFGVSDERDDGWWIDDVTVTNTLSTPAVPAVDANPNTDLPGFGAECAPVRPAVAFAFPGDGAVDVALSSSIVLGLSRSVNPATVNISTFRVLNGGIKAPGTIGVSPDGLIVSFDPSGALAANSIYTVELTSDVLSPDGDPVVPFMSSFDTAGSSSSGSQGAEEVGENGGGAAVGGDDIDDNSGTSTTVLGDVNGDLIADLLIGSPNANDGATLDAGKVKLVFGSPGLQSNSGSIADLTYLGVFAGDKAGQSVGRAGDIDNDGIEDFIVGVPFSDVSGADSGAAFLVFGDSGLDEQSPGPISLSALASCPTATQCGVEFRGEAAGDEAGFTGGFAGDINNDQIDDLLIGAPGANVDAGKVYLIYGPLAAGVIDLADVGSTVAGLVFEGEDAGDRAGEAVSNWPDQKSDGYDDLLIGAPLASTTDEFGATVTEAGYVYMIHGGTTNLDDSATPGVIALSRVANGAGDEVAGVVFLGTEPAGQLGRTVTGAVDIDGDGENDVMVGQDNTVWAIRGDELKLKSSSTAATTRPDPGLARELGVPSVGELFEVIRFVPGSDGDIGGTVVGLAGDVNNDGVEDFAVGAPSADPNGQADAGIVYIVYGSPAIFGAEEVELSDVGTTEYGFRLEGAEPGDQLGASVSGGADVNADGVDDVVAGAPFADTGAGTPENAGETYVVSPVTPEEVVTVLLGQSGAVTTLEWTVPAQAGSYNVYRGLLSVLQGDGVVRTSSWTQLACGIDTDADANQLPDTTDGDPPPATPDVFVYLVTARNGGGEGPLGTLGAVPTRIHDGQCP